MRRPPRTRTRNISSSGMPRICPRWKKTGHQHYAIDHALHCRRSEAERDAQIVPMRQQITADQFACAKRQYLVGEEPDIDGLRGAPKAQPDHWLQERAPSPRVYRSRRPLRHPLPAQSISNPVRAARAAAPLLFVAVQHPCQGGRRENITRGLRRPRRDFRSREEVRAQLHGFRRANGRKHFRLLRSWPIFAFEGSTVL